MRGLTFLLGLHLFVFGCSSGSDIPPIPTSHHPKGEDIVEGVVLAATETSGGSRLYKVVHVDDYPPPIDYEFHMIAYEPKAQTWEEAARMWKDKKVTVAKKHISVRRVNFLTRDYRILFTEPVTPEERKPYEESKIKYPVPPPPPAKSSADPSVAPSSAP